MACLKLIAHNSVTTDIIYVHSYSKHAPVALPKPDFPKLYALSIKKSNKLKIVKNKRFNNYK